MSHHILQLVGINVIPVMALDAFDFASLEKLGVVGILLAANWLFWNSSKSDRKKTDTLYRQQIEKQEAIIKSQHDQLKKYRSED